MLKQRAVRFIIDRSGKPDPFFMLIATKAVHDEGQEAIPAPQYANMFKDVSLPMGPSFNKNNEKEVSHKSLKARPIHGVTLAQLTKSYRAELQSLQSVDDLVASVVDALKETGKLDDTVIIYTSDNGFMHGEHRLIGKSAAYEELIKVPLLMRGPGIPKNETRSELVNNLDVVATIARACRRHSSARSRRPLAHHALCQRQCPMAKRYAITESDLPCSAIPCPLHRRAHGYTQIREIRQWLRGAIQPGSRPE